MGLKLLIISLLLSFLQSNPAPKVILFYGDSLTAGYGLPGDAAFPAVLEKALRARGHRNRIGYFLHIPCPPPEVLTGKSGVEPCGP